MKNQSESAVEKQNIWTLDFIKIQSASEQKTKIIVAKLSKPLSIADAKAKHKKMTSDYQKQISKRTQNKNN